MRNSGNILIVDDNKSVLDSLKLYLKRKFELIETCSNPNRIPELLRSHNFNVVVLDMNFKAGINTGNEGLYWLKEVLKKDKDIVIILITAYGDVNLAVEAMKYGANDFILKPWDNQKLYEAIKNGVEIYNSRKTNSDTSNEDTVVENRPELPNTFPGSSQVMQEIYKTIQKVSQTDANVLILGENGTGKEVVAQEIHRLSKRSDKVFHSVDMGAISETLFESELFGHKKGAFTDAREDRKGRFQTASGGTLFLDEIGNLSLPMQAKLLSVLQNRKVTPVGANTSEKVDIRLVCATNRDPEEMTENSEFREDLLYRINTIQIDLPPLRERGEDIINIANYYLALYAEKYNKPGLKFNPDAIRVIYNYPWPGNIRELKHSVERAVILSDDSAITQSDFNLSQKQNKVELGNTAISLEDAEKMIIENAMRRNKGNISHVAKELNIGRQTLYRKLEKYGL